MPKSSWAPPKAMRGKCERGHGSANADGAGAEVFAGDGCSQGASFGPMAAISQRGQGGRIYNNTRTREPLRRKCVKPADRTTHSPPKTFAHPRTLPLPHAAPTHIRRLRDAFLAALTTHSPSKTFARPRTTTRPSRALPLPTQPRRTPADPTKYSPPKICSRPRAATRPARAFSHSLPAPTHTRRLRDAFLAALTTHSSPKTSARPRTATRPSRTLPLPRPATMHARRPHHPFPADLTTHFPSKICSRPRTATRPARALSHPLPAPTHTRKLRDARPPTS